VAPMKSRLEMSQVMQDTCRDCHKKKYKEYDDSIHALLIEDGNDKAPLCSNCHNSHTQASVKAVAPVDKTPCADCHEKIFKAYLKDVHGLERVAKGKTAPICADCHQTHGVKAASLGDGPKGACLNCHKKALQQHKEWLPNAGLHFESVSCVVCHAPSAQRRVNLRLYNADTKIQLREKSGVPQFAARAKAGDAGQLGLDERALFSLLDQFSQDGGAAGKVVVRGRLEVRDGVQAHQLAEKEKALKDCDACHKEGAEPFQSVVLSIASADGRPLRHDVRKDVLSSLTALESVRGFYAIGSTRIKLLDWLLVLALAGSIGGCAAHLLMKRMTQGMRDRLAAEAVAAKAAKTAADQASNNALAGPPVRDPGSN
jgi:deoxycytidylate deaminase